MNLKKLIVEENVGGLDLTLRAMFGVLSMILLSLGVAAGVWKWLLVLVAFVGLFSAITRHCTPYALIGFSTAKKK